MLSSILIATICRVWTVFTISAAYTVIWQSLSVKDCVPHWARIIIIIIITFLVLCHLNKEDHGCITISVQLPEISRMMSPLHHIWKDKRLSSTPNQITSLPSTGHISRSFSRWPRAGHQRKSLNAYDRCSTSDGTRMSPTRILSLTSVFSKFYRGAVGRKIRAGRRPQGVPHFSQEGVHSKCFSSVPGVRHFVLGLHLCFFCSQHIAHHAPQVRNRLWKRRCHTVHCTVRW